MSSKITLSVLGLYNYDETIFNNMKIPESVDRETLINNILMECSEFEVLYPDAPFFKFAVEAWSKKEYPVWDKLNTIWNTDIDVNNEYDYERKRTPNISHTKTGTETETPSGQIIDSATNASTSENRNQVTDNNTATTAVSAYNASTFENRDQVTNNNTATTTESASNTSTSGNTRSFNQYKNEKEFNTVNSETGSETITEKGHKRSAAELIKEATDAAIFNIYDYITESFKERFCILVY